MDYRSSPLAEQSQHYDNNVSRHIAKMTKRLELQLKVQIFDRSDPITILSFLPVIQMGCDANGVYEGASIW